MPRKKTKGVTVGLNDLITQPRKMASLPALNSRVGQRTLLAILQRLQGLFKLAKEHERDPQLYLNFETDDFEVKRKSTAGYNEGDVLFNLSLSDIAEPNHYPEVRAALRDLLDVHVLVPIPEEPGHFRTESLMQMKLPLNEKGELVGTEFGVIIPRLTAENILDINMLGGYSRFLLFTASQFRSEYGYALYIRLSDERQKHGDVFEIGYEDLRNNMGFVVEMVEKKDKNGKKIVVQDDSRAKKHASWSLFCRYVLDQTKQELAAMSQRTPPATDFTFEYEGRLNGGPLPKYKRPDAVRFTIIPTSTGRQISADNTFASQSIRCRKMMKQFFQLTEGHARSLMRRVTPDNIDGLISQMEDWKLKLDMGALQWHNIPATAYTCIYNYLEDAAQPEIEVAAHAAPDTPAAGTVTASANPFNDVETW